MTDPSHAPDDATRSAEGARLPSESVPVAIPADDGAPTIDAQAGSDHAETADPDSVADHTEVIQGLLAPAQAPDELGRLGRYRVLRVLGRGGMGVVFEAEDNKLKRKVALKAMLPSLAVNASARKRFIREAETAAKVEHDNIVPIYDIADVNGVPFLAMPMLVGEPLDARLKASAPLSVADVLAIGKHIAEGLAAAHAAGLIHRDIKPNNIWLERTPRGAFKRARILDFGLARSLRDGADLTHSGAVMGTPAYMAPEQARAQAVDHRADLFSLGCVLYQMTTGRRPFRGDDTLAVLNALANDTPPAPIEVNPALPPALSTLIERLLSKNADNRWPPSAQEVADELNRIALPQPVVVAVPVPLATAPRAEDVWVEATVATVPADEVPLATSAEPEATPPARRRGGHGPLYLAVAAVLGAVVVAATVFFATRGSSSGPPGHDPTNAPRVNPKEEPKKLDAPPSKDNPDRKAAEALHPHATLDLKLADGHATRIKSTEPLPAGAFVITGIDLWSESGVLPADFATNVFLPAVAELRSLEQIYDPQPRMTANEALLIQLAKAPVAANLTDVWLTNATITVRNIDNLKRFPKLKAIALHGSEADDNALLRLKELTQLKRLGITQLLRSERVTEKGYSAIATLPLEELHLQHSMIDPTYAKQLAANPTITHLGFWHSDIKDDALLELAKSPRLITLNIIGTPVGDLGLDHLRRLPSLHLLRLEKTKVTKGGVEKLAAARPDLTITWDGPQINPTVAGTPVDLLALVDTKRDAVAGRWKLVDGALVGGGTTFVELGIDRLQVPYSPPNEYDAVMVVQRTGVDKAGPNTVCRFALTLAGLYRCQAFFDTPIDNKIMNGLQLIDGKTVIANETRTYGDFFGKDGTTVVITCRVRKDGVTVLTDGQERFKWKGDVSKLTHDDSLWKYPDKSRLAVAVQNAEYRISEWRVYPVAASSDPNPVPLPLTAEQRKALEWVISVGGIVVLQEGGQNLTVRPDGKLPDGPVLVEHIELANAKGVDDVTIENLKHCPPVRNRLSLPKVGRTDATLAKLATYPGPRNCRHLGMYSPQVTDKDLVQLKDFPNLTSVSLLGTSVTDTGIPHLRAIPKLTALSLDHLPLTDAGLAQLKGLPLLTLGLQSCNKITADGFAHLREMKSLRILHLGASSLNSAGLASLKNLTELEILDISKSKVTAAGFEHLAALKNLRILDLSHLPVTDASLGQLVALGSLRELNLKNANVTKAGVEKLALALPNCRIEWDGGVLEPQVGAVMHADGTFPGEVVLREPFDKVPADVVGISGKSATAQSNGGVVEVRWPDTPGRRVPSTFMYPFGPGVENIAFAVRYRIHGNASVGLNFRTLDNPTGRSGMSLNIKPDGTWSLIHWGNERKNGKVEISEPVVLKQSSGPDADLVAGKWVVVTVFSAGATTEIHVNGRLLTSVTDAKPPTGTPAIAKGALDFGVSLLDTNAVGFDLDYLVVWKLPTRDADRRCAEWVLAGDGRVTIRVGGQEAALTKPDLLRGEPFRIVAIAWQSSPRAVTDADLDYIAPLTDLTRLVLGQTEITDDGLKRLAGFPVAAKLTRLGLDSSRVTDAGLAHLKGLPLQSLTLKGRDHLTAEGLAHLAQIKTLRGLLLDGSSIDGAGLAALKPLADLDELGIGQTKVTATGFEHLAAFKKLITLNLQSLPLTDDGLDVLAGLAQLRNLNLKGTNVTKAGAEKLAGKLPGCKIDYPGGVIEPKK